MHSVAWWWNPRQPRPSKVLEPEFLLACGGASETRTFRGIMVSLLEQPPPVALTTARGVHGLLRWRKQEKFSEHTLSRLSWQADSLRFLSPWTMRTKKSLILLRHKRLF